MGTKHGLLKCRSLRRKPSGEQWSRRETVEARGTKWNFDVEMDSGICGPQVDSRPDVEMPTATARGEIPSSTDPNPKRSKTTSVTDNENLADRMDEDNFRRGPATSHQLEPVDDENLSRHEWQETFFTSMARTM